MTAVLAVFHAHSERYLRVVGGIKSHDGGVELRHCDDLRRACFRADVLLADTLEVVDVVPAALHQEVRVFTYALHSGVHLRKYVLHALGEIRHHLWLYLLDELGVVVVVDSLHDVRAVPYALVRDGHCLGRQVQRSQQGLRLTDTRLDRIRRVPLDPELVEQLRGGHSAGGHRQLKAEVGAYAEFIRPVRQPVDTHAARGLVEENVAGVLKSELHSDGAVNSGTARGVARRVVHIPPRAVDSAGGVDNTLRKTRRRGDGLECGAGTVLAVYRAVQQRGVLSVQNGRVVLDELVYIVARERRHRQHRAVPDVQHDCGAYLGILASEVRVHRRGVVRGVQEIHVVLHYPLHHVLEVRVYRQHYGLPRLRLLGYLVGDHHAVGVTRYLAGAALAAQRGFQRKLDTRCADDVVQLVAGALQLGVLIR